MGLLDWLLRRMKRRKRCAYRRILRATGPWKPYDGHGCMPGTALPAQITLPAEAAKWGDEPGPMPLDRAVFPYWLHLGPALVGFVIQQLRKGGMYRELQLERRDKPPRVIHEPAPILKFFQRRILQRILEQVTPHDAAHGFIKGRSIFTNAAEHTKRRVVVCMDLRDFFPSITFSRVTGLFAQIGFSGPVAGRLAALCTFQGKLPQGAPTSPMITNLICRRMDARLRALLKKHGGNYTRYADDLTFSGDETILRVLPLVRQIVKEEGFTEAREKFRIQRSGSRQTVTGLVVNDRVTVPRRVRRTLRAMVHRYGSDFANHAEMRRLLMGYINFMRPAHPVFAQQQARKLARG